MLKIAMACFVVCLTAASAVASPFPPTQVGAGRDTSGHIACQALHKPAAAAITEALHRNQVRIATASQVADYEAVEAHVEILAQYTTDGCAVGLLFRFQSNQPVMVAAELGIRRVDLILCERRGLLSGPPQLMQKRIDSWLRAVVDECVSEVGRET